MLVMRIVPKTYTDLATLVKAPSGDYPEALPDVLWDTIQYPAAGTAGLLNFFQNANANLADPSLSNLPAGRLDTYQYFEIHRVFSNFDSVPTITTTAAVTGIGNDVSLVLHSWRAWFNFVQAAKTLGPIKLLFAGRAGGVDPFVATEGSETSPARNIIQFADSLFNGGFPVNGQIILQPAQAFAFNIGGNGTAVAISAALNICLALMGVRHRKVG